MLLYYLLGEPGSDFTFISGIIIGTFFVITIGTTFFSRDLWACSGMFILLFFFIMFDVWEHHYTLLLPILVIMWIRGGPGERSRWMPFILAFVMSIPMLPVVELLAGIDPGVHPISMDTIWLILYHSSKVIPALVLYIWLVIVAFRSPRKVSYEESARDAYLIAWKNLVSGIYPRIEGGIITQKEQGAVSDNSNQASI
jgi:hypothetical protein